VPLSLDRLFFRLDHALRWHDKALVAVEKPRSSPVELARYWIYECELRDGGRVSLCDMPSRALKLGVVEPCESIVEDSWASSPIPQ
jgi:hypothetical protein